MKGITEIDYKIETKKLWNLVPCGTDGKIKEELEFFLNVEKYRYEVYAPWMLETFKFEKYKGKKFLEIGCGLGTDLVQFAKAGAECYGIDLVEKHYQLASKNFKLRGLKANLFLGDAAKLPFEDNFFDVVYSFGVLHHTPDTIRCISEVYRVLKPGGRLF